MRKILICEDNVDLSDMMRNFLIKAGHSVYQAFDGAQAIELARKLQPDLILLDIMMPQYNGYEVCQNIRFDMNIPIIVVSARDNEEDKEKLFELGADDYMTKPFSFKEMVLRVNAQLRRYYEFNNKVDSDVRKYGDLTISPEKAEVTVKGKPLNLTVKEFKLLDCLTEHADMIFSKEKLIDTVWGMDEYIDEKTVTVTIARLREKLVNEGINNIVTVWGFGYKWQSEL